MRVDVVIDDELMAEALAFTGLHSEQAVIEESLRLLVQVVAQERVHELWKKRHSETGLSTMQEQRIPDL